MEELLSVGMAWLIRLFPNVLNISAVASVVILFVLLARLMLRRAPKVFSYALWLVVLLRLLAPITIHSPVSVVPEVQATSEKQINQALPSFDYVSGEDRADNIRNQMQAEQQGPGTPYVTVSTTVDPAVYLAIIWIAGIAFMLFRSALSYLRIRRQTRIALPLSGNAYIADDVQSPFVIGFFRPKIYLPGTLTDSEQDLILCHERHHIRRGDHIFKALGFLALNIHWFNPLVWLAFILASRDMEMSCDEAVIRELGENVRAEYSAALLNLAVGRRLISGTPLAFGEGDPKGRIRNLAKWKKPTFFVVLICVLLCTVLAVSLLTSPSTKQAGELSGSSQYFVLNEEKTIWSGAVEKYGPDALVAVGLKETTGPLAFSVDASYRTGENAQWISLGPRLLNTPQEVCTFRVPAGCSYTVSAIPTQGKSGYAEFQISDSGIFALADIPKSDVEQITLRNLHNGAYTYITEETAISRLCSFLDSIYGVNSGSAKGYYEGTYEITLSFSGTSEQFSLAFGDNDTFYLGKGEDGYPIRYLLMANTTANVVAHFSPYDASQFDWAVAGKTEAAAETAPSDDWGVSIRPERVTRTGATAAFVYSGSVPGETGAELTYGDFLSLDRLENGSWVSVPEKPGYEYFVGDSSYPVVDGYGMVHEWQSRFGELADGRYRLGKLVTLTRPDGTFSQQMVYGEFSIPDSILTGPIPLAELPEIYSAEQAMIDGCFVMTDGVAMDNKEVFTQFASNAESGIPGSVRIVNWHYGDDARWSAVDLTFDGTAYTITTQDSNTYTFRFLKRYAGEKEKEDDPYDAYEYYVLVNTPDATFQDIQSGKLGELDHWTVYADWIFYPRKPELPADPIYAVLEFKGSSLVVVTDAERVEKIHWLFDSGSLLGYEPKTHSIGVGLNLILTDRSGEDFIIELDPDQDICRINGEYVSYGAADEPDYIAKLWEYLGITQWPDIVYQQCENALRP